MSAAITVSEVYKNYKSTRALRGISLDIGQGEFFGLLGPNGAGKSTLINIIAGLTRADQGDCTVMTHDVRREYRRARRCLGVVPQELAFDPFFSVREVLRIQSGYFGLGRENSAWIDQLLDALKLTEKADANMRTLSGGMKRRVLIAQALVHKPEVVVLDEPTAGVDVELRKLLWSFIQQLHREGHTIVLTTHYLEEAEALCERIAILDHGEVVALDSKQRLLERGIGETITVAILTKEPVRDVPRSLAHKLKRKEGVQLEFQLIKNADSIIDLLDTLRRSGVEVLDLHTERADLEDVFLALTYGKGR